MRSTRLVLAVIVLAAFVTLPLAAQQPEMKSADPADPLFGAYLDTAATRKALATRPRFTDTRRAARILTVSFDSLGNVASVRAPVEAAMPLPERDTLIAIIRSHALAITPRTRGWETHLLLTTGPDARVEETYLERLDPAVADRMALTRRLERETQRLMQADSSLGDETLVARLRLRLRADGTVESHTIALSSGRANVDEAAVRIVTQTSFTPAVVEGERVPSWVVLPIRFVFPE